MQSLQKEVPGAPDTLSDQTDLLHPPSGTQESAPSALLWRLWIHSSKSWGGGEVSSDPRNAQLSNPRRHRGSHYLLLTVHCCPKLNNRNQLHSLLAVLPGLLPFSPGKGYWDNSTFTGLWDHKRQQPTLNAGSNATLKQTQTSFSKGVSRCPISGT